MRRSRAATGARARLAGRRGEIVSALWLIAKGYAILGFRLKTPHGEIDLLVKKGAVVAVVEVKLRSSIEQALEAVTGRQRERLTRAAQSYATNRPDLAGCSVRLDLMALAPGRWPCHIRNAWTPDGPVDAR
jgi:putative endonuclease